MLQTLRKPNVVTQPEFNYDLGSNNSCGPGGCETVEVPRTLVNMADLLINYINSLPEPLWETNFEAALAKAEPDGIVMALFSASNCGFCQQLQSNIFDKPYFHFWVLIHSATRPLVLFKDLLSDYHYPNDVAKEHNVGVQGGTGFPTVIGLNPDGSERGRVVGYNAAQYMWQWYKSFEDAAKLHQSP